MIGYTILIYTFLRHNHATWFIDIYIYVIYYKRYRIEAWMKMMSLKGLKGQRWVNSYLIFLLDLYERNIEPRRERLV